MTKFNIGRQNNIAKFKLRDYLQLHIDKFKYLPDFAALDVDSSVRLDDEDEEACDFFVPGNYNKMLMNYNYLW